MESWLGFLKIHNYAFYNYMLGLGCVCCVVGIEGFRRHAIDMSTDTTCVHEVLTIEIVHTCVTAHTSDVCVSLWCFRFVN